jgi:hypothetical protein
MISIWGFLKTSVILFTGPLHSNFYLMVFYADDCVASERVALGNHGLQLYSPTDGVASGRSWLIMGLEPPYLIGSPIQNRI